MASYYIDQQSGIGYVVTQLDTANLDDGYLSNRYVRNFGDRQTDAIEFRDDCNNGKIDPRRIRLLMDTYTPQPYKYLGKGNLRKQNNT